jgi:hypothetical protein
MLKVTTQKGQGRSPNFSLEGYCELLSAFKDTGYSFCEFEEIDYRLGEEQPFLLLRHDIDISLRPALEIAHIEYELGVQATYFVLLRSPFYNLLSRPNADIMLQIHRYGHQLALHVDLAAYDGDYARALTEVDILSKFYPYINTQLASLHSPYSLDQIPIESYRQLHNVYGPALRSDIAYISDSTGRWLYGHPLNSEAFSRQKPIQLLTHPIWWSQDGETATKKLEIWFHNDYLNTCAIAKEFLPKLFRLGSLEQVYAEG